MQKVINISKLSSHLFISMAIVALLLAACDLAPVPQPQPTGAVTTPEVAGVNTVVVAPTNYLATAFAVITSTVQISPTADLETALTPTP